MAGRAAKASPKSPRKRAAPDWAERASALPGARRLALKAEPYKPQLATLADAPPGGEEWIHEWKWDGFRLIAVVVRGRARLWSRNAIEWTAKVPGFVRALESLGITSGAFDGEMIAGQGTQEDFNALQASLSVAEDAGRTYAIFDVLHLEGIDVSQAPLIERKGLLAGVLAGAPAGLSFSEHFKEGKTLFAQASKLGFEGIISKRANAPYRHGRNDDWRKTKRAESDEYAVIGYTEGQGKRAGAIGSLLVAQPDGKGGWRYAGRVGTGFNATNMPEIQKLIGRAGTDTPTVEVPKIARPAARGAKWFKPRFVVELNLRGIGTSGIVRQASLKALRPDKVVSDLKDSDRAR